MWQDVRGEQMRKVFTRAVKNRGLRMGESGDHSCCGNSKTWFYSLFIINLIYNLAL